MQWLWAKLDLFCSLLQNVNMMIDLASPQMFVSLVGKCLQTISKIIEACEQKICWVVWVGSFHLRRFGVLETLHVLWALQNTFWSRFLGLRISLSELDVVVCHISGESDDSDDDQGITFTAESDVSARLTGEDSEKSDDGSGSDAENPFKDSSSDSESEEGLK